MAEILRKYTKALACALNDDELRQYGSNLAGVLEQIDVQAEREDSVKKELKAAMTKLEAERTELAIKIRRREEMRDVEVSIEVDEAGVVSEIRADTGAVIQQRPLREEERQQLLKLDEERKAQP